MKNGLTFKDRALFTNDMAEKITEKIVSIHTEKSIIKYNTYS